MLPLKYCEKCLGNGYKTKIIKTSNGHELPLKKYVVYNGFISMGTSKLPITNCPECNTLLQTLHITQDEWLIIQETSVDPEFVFALDKLKQDDIIEFNVKMAQFKQTAEAIKQTKELQQQSQQITTTQSTTASSTSSSTKSTTNIPKCPTCGSTNVRKISATKRWVGVGLFGLASSDATHTMQCNDCGAKW